MNRDIINLDHPLFEVKERAIKRILQKIEYGILNISAFLKDTSFVGKIVHLLKDDSVVLKKYAVDLLQFILKAEEGYINFQSSGGFFVLHNIQPEVPSYLAEKINSLLQRYQINIEKCNTSCNVMEEISNIEANNNISSNNSSIINLQAFNILRENDFADSSSYAERKENSHYSIPIFFTTFPWLNLTQLDNKILESTAQSLVEPDDVTFRGIMLFCQTVLFKDFPVEVLLQRPFIIQVLLSNLADPQDNTWRKQEIICHTLESFNYLLGSRMINFESINIFIDTDGKANKSSRNSSLTTGSHSLFSNQNCCKRSITSSVDAINQITSVETIHESDDADEFIILQVNQLNVVNWCCQVMTLCFYLINTPHQRLSSALLGLIPFTMEILRSCIDPKSLWLAASEENIEIENMDLIKDISSSLLRGLNILSNSINILYQERDTCSTKHKIEENARRLKNVSTVFMYFIKLFSPENHFHLIFHDQELRSFSYLLSDVGFYSEYPEDHCQLLSILRELDKDSALQIDALINNIYRFESCKAFLQISSSETNKFQMEAEKAIPVLFIHQSRVFIEKLVRGLAKQAATSVVTDMQILMARKLLIQLLQCPDEQSRIFSYRAVYNLIIENVGITQARNMSKGNSAKILVLLHPRILNHLIFSGCSDSNAEIIEFSQNSILSLIRGNQLMSSNVQRQMVECFSSCLLNLQNLASSLTLLGRAILDLPYQLLILSPQQNLGELICIKFHLKSLFNKDEKVREQAMRNCMALLVTSNFESFVSPYMLGSSEEYYNLLVFNPSVDLFAILPVVDNMDFLHLQKSLLVLENESKDSTVIESAWIQISFFLHNPILHADLEKIWPIEKTKLAFLKMMKLSGEGGLTVSQVPTALEVMRLRAAYSPYVRSFLCNDLTFLMAVFRALLFFKNNPRVHLETSLLLTLLLNEDVIRQSKIQQNLNLALSKSYCTASFPKVVSSSQYIALLHENYNWEPYEEHDASIRELYSMLQSENLKIPSSPINFFKVMWAAICAEHYSALSVPYDYSQNFSQLFALSNSDSVILTTSISKSYINKLLTDLENSTSHKDVKYALNIVESVLILVRGNYSKIKEILLNDKWTGVLSRFFLCMPSTSLDTQIFYHVMKVVLQILQLITCVVQILGNVECLCCSLVRLLISELALQGSTLSALLRLAGNVEFEPSSPSAENVESILIFHCLISNVSKLLQLHNQFKCDCQNKQLNWIEMSSNIAKMLASIVGKCKTVPNFNLVVLVPSLECLIKLAKVSYDVDIFHLLIPVIIDLQMSFHIGRGRAHNVYLGRAVSIRCLMLLSLIVSAEAALPNLAKIISILEEEVPSLPWLLSSLEHTDKNIVAAGLKIVLGLSCSVAGSKVLDEAFEELSGGIWVLILKLFVCSDTDNLIRLLSCQILTNLCYHAANLAPSDIPWQSISIIDSQTGKTASGKEALKELLSLFGIFPLFQQFLKTIYPPKEDEKVVLPALFDSALMKDFVTSEESLWASIIDDLEEKQLKETPTDLIEASLQLLSNLLMVDFQAILNQCVDSYVIHSLVKHLALLTKDAKINDSWINIIEYGFNILLLIGQNYSKNSHLSSLAINIFSTDCISSESLFKSSLMILSQMAGSGGWGAVRVIELISVNPAHIFKIIIKFLHQQSPHQETAIDFIGALCQAGTYKSESEGFILSSLKALLDVPLYLEQDQEETCLGWEICRHFIQLLPSELVLNSKCCYSLQKENGNLKLLLEGLKLLFSISESGRCCAYYRFPVLAEIIQKSLVNLHGKILTTNLHITSNLFNKKVLKNDILFATHCLQVATNWLLETSTQNLELTNDKSEIVQPVTLCEAIIPLLHPLWVAALHTPPLMEAVLHFMVSATSYAEVCPVFTRTSILPGSLLSGSRTNKSLLVSIVATVTQLLDKRKFSYSCSTSYGSLNSEFLTDALDIILNCSLVHETAYVLVKDGLLQCVVGFLYESRELNSLVPQKCISILASLTFHKEARQAVIKIPVWIKCLRTCGNVAVLLRYVMITYSNMIRSEPAVKKMLTSDDFIKHVLSVLNQMTNAISSNSQLFLEEDVHVTLLCIWSLAANNQRCKTILKNFLAVSDLKVLIGNLKHTEICQNIIQIIES